MRVAIFTDGDLDKVNGLSTTLRAMSRHAPRPWSPRIYTAADSGVEQPDYFSAASLGIGLPWYRDTRIYWPRLRHFARMLRRDDVGLIHITTPGPVGLVARWLAVHLNLPCVGSYHMHLGRHITASSGSKRLGRLMDDYMRWLYGPCHSLLVPSTASADLLIAPGHSRERLRLWPRGVDVQQFNPGRRSAALRRQWGVDDRRPAILYAGRLAEDRGLAIVAPVQRLLHRHGVEHRFVFVGDGPMGTRLNAECPDGVFAGNLTQDAVAVAMASADVFLFPSSDDAFGDAVLESQASGIPALVPDRGGPREHLTHVVTGYACRAGDVQAFGSRIVELLRSRTRRLAMGAAAHLSAEARSWPLALRPLCDAWRQAAGGPAGLGDVSVRADAVAVHGVAS
jgi:glycosyltransferase involved in cell wall biosynthesis